MFAHPECTWDVLELADFIGSTSQIIDYATGNNHKKFIISTEMGVFYEFSQKNPDKKFYSVGHCQFCLNMKKISLEKVVEVLRNPANEVVLEKETIEKANVPLESMLKLAEG